MLRLPKISAAVSLTLCAVSILPTASVDVHHELLQGGSVLEQFVVNVDATTPEFCDRNPANDDAALNNPSGLPEGTTPTLWKPWPSQSCWNGSGRTQWIGNKVANPVAPYRSSAGVKVCLWSDIATQQPHIT